MIIMKLAIVGSRDFNDYEFLKKKVDELRKQYDIDEIVSGGARGADSLAERYANEHNLKLKIFPADWKKYGKSAGYIRNKQIWEYADIGIAFWDGKSPGTKHSIKLSDKLNKKLFLILYEQNNEELF